MTDYEPLMEEAVRLAIANVRSGGGGPFGALIVRDGKIVARGTNLVTVSNDPTAHAEIVAIRRASRQLGHFHLTGATLVTTCEPCPMCLGAAYWARVDRIVYSATRSEAAAAGFMDDEMYEQVAMRPEERSIEMLRLDGAAADLAFEAWRAFDARVDY